MIYVLTNVSKTQDVPLDGTIRDFKIRYGKGLLRLHKVKISSGNVPRELHYGFPAVASFSATSNCLLCRTLQYVSINCLCHFKAYYAFLRNLLQRLST